MVEENRDLLPEERLDRNTAVDLDVLREARRLREEVKRRLAPLTERQLRRGALKSTAELEAAICRFKDVTDEGPRPLGWHETAHQMLASFKRLHRLNSKTVP